MSTVEYTARIHQEDDGSFWAEVSELPGCFASGHSLEELREGLSEAISLYLRDDPEAGHIPDPLDPQPMRIDEMRVSVPC